MISSWPVYDEAKNYAETERNVELIKEAVRSIRGVRLAMDVPPSRKAKVFVVSSEEAVRSAFENGKNFFAALASASEVEVQASKEGIPEDAVSAVSSGAACFLPLEDLVDVAKEIERLTKEQKRLQGEIARSNGMLNNERFLSKAPEAKVQEETPAFTTLQSATVPVRKKGPKRAQMCIIFLFLAFLGTTAYVLHKEDDLKPLLGLS